MISRAFFNTVRRALQRTIRAKSVLPLPEVKPQNEHFFTEQKEMLSSALKDQQVPSVENIKDSPAVKKDSPPQKDKNPPASKKEPTSGSKEKDSGEKKEATLKCSSGSSDSTSPPPKGPENPNLLRRPEFPGKVRLAFIPEEWFQFFYRKTGVTGPYVFGVGLLTYLASKEIYVMEHEYYTGLSFGILLALLVKKLGQPTAVYADKLIDKHEASWEQMHKSDLEQLQKDIDRERKEQWRADGALMLIEAKRQMIDMQLETAYREQIMEVYKEIIQRLDYQIECANVHYRLNHKHMMFWLHDQVAKAIKDEQVNEAEREKRKADLSAMVIRIKDFETAADIRAGSSFTNQPS